MSPANDRTVFARSADGLSEVVRYDRAGKWRLEGPDGKHNLGVLVAAQAGLEFAQAGGRIIPNLPGGARFYSDIERQKAAQSRLFTNL